MVVGLAADGDVALPDLELADGPLVVVVGSEGKGLSPPGRRDLRPARLDPDGQPAGVAQRRSGRVGDALLDRAGARPGVSRARVISTVAVAVGVPRRRGGRDGHPVPLREQDDRRGQPRRDGAADPRRGRGGAHRAAAARRTPPGRRAGRGRARARQDRGRVDRRADRPLRLHRQPARGARWPRWRPRSGTSPCRPPSAASASAWCRSRSGCSSGRTGAVSCSAGCAPAAAPWPGCCSWPCRSPSGSRGTATRTPRRPSRTGSRWAPSSAAAVPLPDEADGIEVRSDVDDHPDPPADRQRGRAPTTRARRSTPRPPRTPPTSSCASPRRARRSRCSCRDRHDNIGMDPVARAVGDAGGATAVLDAGDDTSTGQPWEAFSLDSLDERLRRPRPLGRRRQPRQRAVRHRLPRRPGLDDLRRRGRRGPGRRRVLGVDDPRSSGLGDWRDETGLSFTEVGERLADAACASEERHRHPARARRQPRPRGPRPRLRRPRGRRPHPRPARAGGGRSARTAQVGWTYTNGTTGGAAYAIAVGSKPRRDAGVSLVTYGEDGRPVGSSRSGSRPTGPSSSATSPPSSTPSPRRAEVPVTSYVVSAGRCRCPW